MADLMRPEDLKKISDDADMAQAQEYIRRAKKQEDERKGLREAFMEKGIHPEVRDRVNAAVRRAAEQGKPRTADRRLSGQLLQRRRATSFAWRSSTIPVECPAMSACS